MDVARKDGFSDIAAPDPDSDQLRDCGGDGCRMRELHLFRSRNQRSEQTIRHYYRKYE